MDLLKSALNIGNNIKNFVKSKRDKLRDVLNAPAPDWMQKADTSLRTFSQKAANTPKFSFAEKGKTPVSRFALSIPQTFLNIPSNFSRTALSDYGAKPTPSFLIKKAGQAASVGLDIGSFFGGGAAAKTVATQAYKQGLKRVLPILKQGAITGAKQGAGYGAGYGAAQGAQEGNTPGEQFKNIFKQGAVGTAAGLVLGAGLGAGVSGTGLVVKRGINEARNVGRDIKSLLNPEIVRSGGFTSPISQTVKDVKPGMGTFKFGKDGKIEKTGGFDLRHDVGDRFIPAKTEKMPFTPNSEVFKFIMSPKAGMSIQDINKIKDPIEKAKMLGFKKFVDDLGGEQEARDFAQQYWAKKGKDGKYFHVGGEKFDSFDKSKSNYDPSVRGGGISAINGLYVGKDKKALSEFYGMSIDADGKTPLTKNFFGEPKWLDLTNRADEEKLIEAVQKKTGITNTRSKEFGVALEEEIKTRGYDGAKYFDPYATGEEYVLVNHGKLTGAEKKIAKQAEAGATAPFEPKSGTFKFLKEPKAGMSTGDITKGASKYDYKGDRHLTEFENADLSTAELKKKLMQLTEGNEDPALIQQTSKDLVERLGMSGKEPIPHDAQWKEVPAKKTGLRAPTFDNFQDNTFGGVAVKGEGDFVTIRLNKNTGKPLGDKMVSTDDVVTLSINRGEYNQAKKSKATLEALLQKKRDEALGGATRQTGARSAQEVIDEAVGGKKPEIAPKTIFQGETTPPQAVRPGQNKTLANLGLNTAHLNISDEGKAVIAKGMEELKPTLEKTVGKVMTKEEVAKAAESTAKTLQKTLSRDEILRIGGQAQNLRQEIAALAEKGTMTPELMDAMKRDKEFSSGTARLLQQRGNDVDPVEKNAMLQMVELVNSKVDDIDAVLKASQGVDFNDAHQSALFYRQFIKPKIGDWVDLLRYNSMLSSPLTHIVNIASNLANSATITPVEKTVAGTIDFLASAVTGKQRKQFAGEGAVFLKGYATSIFDASHRLADVMRGKRASTNLDVRNIPLVPGSKAGTIAENTLSVPLKLLEGMDQFFTALTEGGERAALNYRKGKGVAVSNLEEKVQESAAYRIYRQDLHAKGQGTLLDAIDTVTGMVMKARNAENPVVRNVAKWTVPFIKTPMNIFKQGIEYSPAGVLTLHGAEEKTNQLAKAAIGSSIFMGASMLLGSGRLTWAEPISEKEKNAFRAAGMQAYSVKIGDKWYSYQKLPPALAFSLAMVASIDDTQKNAKLGDDAVDQILTAVAKYGTFLSDQSYAKSIGDLLAAAKGGESGITRLLSNYPQQVIPYRAMGGWLARIGDDTQRKIDPKLGFIDKQVQLLMQNIPGLSDNTPARKDEFGNEIKNPDNVANAFSPVRMSTEQPAMKERFDTMQTEKQDNSRKRQLKEAMKSGGALPDMEGKSAELTALGDAGNYIYALDLEKYVGENKESGIKKFTHDADKATVARNIFEGSSTYKDIPDDVKPAIFEAMGIKQDDVEYDYMAFQPDSAKSQYLTEQIGAQDISHSEILQTLAGLRKESIGGRRLASDGTLDELYHSGMITNQEKLYLKKIRVGKDGTVEDIAGTGGSGAKKKTAAMSKLIKDIMKGAPVPKTNPIASTAKAPKPVAIRDITVDPTLSARPIATIAKTAEEIIRAVAAKNYKPDFTEARRAVEAVRGGGSTSNTPVKLSQSFFKGGRA